MEKRQSPQDVAPHPLPPSHCRARPVLLWSCHTSLELSPHPPLKRALPSNLVTHVRAGKGLEVSYQVPSAAWLAIVLQTHQRGRSSQAVTHPKRDEGWGLALDLVPSAASSPSFRGRRTGCASPANGTTVRLRAESTPGTSLGKWLPPLRVPRSQEAGLSPAPRALGSPPLRW